ncbi:MAG: hypothetical protein ACYCY8_00650 [Burkholderiales bacterium]
MLVRGAQDGHESELPRPERELCFCVPGATDFEQSLRVAVNGL